MKISGTFTPKLAPMDAYSEGSAGNIIGRMSIDKDYTGELSGVGVGEMLSVRTAVAGSAGYVAVECVTGTLDGKSGSFALAHFGLMAEGGDTSLNIEVIPDSGTEALKGIRGKMTIRNEDGAHFYDFDYEL